MDICILSTFELLGGFPGGSDGNMSACNAGDPGLIPGSGISPGEGNGNPLQDSCLENYMDIGAWWATVHGIVKSWTRLGDFAWTIRIVGDMNIHVQVFVSNTSFSFFWVYT